MSRLKKVSNRNIRNLPNIFYTDEDKIYLSKEVIDFIELNFIQTRRNLAFDEVGRVLVSHYVMDRMSLEEYLGGPIDDATCKVVLEILPNETKDLLNNKIIEKLQREGLELKIYKSNYEYGDGVFHIYCILIHV